MFGSLFTLKRWICSSERLWSHTNIYTGTKWREALHWKWFRKKQEYGLLEKNISCIISFRWTSEYSFPWVVLLISEDWPQSNQFTVEPLVSLQQFILNYTPYPVLPYRLLCVRCCQSITHLHWHNEKGWLLEFFINILIERIFDIVKRLSPVKCWVLEAH